MLQLRKGKPGNQEVPSFRSLRKMGSSGLQSSPSSGSPFRTNAGPRVVRLQLLLLFLVLGAFSWVAFVLSYNQETFASNQHDDAADAPPHPPPPRRHRKPRQSKSAQSHSHDPPHKEDILDGAHHPDTLKEESSFRAPEGFEGLVERATERRSFCETSDSQPPPPPITNETTAQLPAFGILDDLMHASDHWGPEWHCQLPPETECQETHLTVIFMGYNPERLTPMRRQIFNMVSRKQEWKAMVKQVILVWNGPRDISETEDGAYLYDLSSKIPKLFRIFFPLKEGFPNDLMNRYHPRFNVTTKAILFYDDDGPFYKHKAVMAGFELWKRNSNAQVGAMARIINLGDRQETEKANRLLEKNAMNDRVWISHCPKDQVTYNFFHFANFGANMVLPSGSILHSNYLCFLWHPALEPIREFVRAHPVHPDDVTVSTIVSHLSGRSPKVYPRRINLQKWEEGNDTVTEAEEEGVVEDEDDSDKEAENNQTATHRRLLMGNQWDTGKKTKKLSPTKKRWADLRTDATNSLLRYFGSINSGSLGWCLGTPYHQRSEKKGKVDTCFPEMARIGMIPWLNPDHTPKETCP